jgi:hypothetical protein
LFFFLIHPLFDGCTPTGAAVKAVPHCMCNFFIRRCSHDSDSGGNLEGFLVGGKSAVSLLLTIGSNEGVDSLDLDLVKLLAGSLDNGLLGASVNDEDEGVVVFDGLDGGFGAHGELDDGVGVEDNGVLGSDSKGNGGALLGLGDWATEGSVVPDLSLLGGVGTFLHGGGSFLGLLISNTETRR